MGVNTKHCQALSTQIGLKCPNQPHLGPPHAPPLPMGAGVPFKLRTGTAAFLWALERGSVCCLSCYLMLLRCCLGFLFLRIGVGLLLCLCLMLTGLSMDLQLSSLLGCLYCCWPCLSCLQWGCSRLQLLLAGAYKMEAWLVQLSLNE